MIEVNNQNIRIWSKLGQRGAIFGSAIFPLLQEHPQIVAMTADLGFLSGMDRFKAAHPDKFVNVGIAEQNLIGMSAALADEGRIPIVTTYATFITMRACEQIRHFLGYMGCNVKVIGSGAGLVMGFSGNTHYTIEDLAITRTIPNLTVFSPSDATEAVKVFEAAVKYKGPVYIRLTGGLNVPMVYKDDYQFEAGKAVTLKSEGRIAIVATGSMVNHALKASLILQAGGIQARVINYHTIKPFDRKAIEKIIPEVDLFVTVEEHSIINGLGGAVAEVLSEFKQHGPLVRIGIHDEFKHAGDYADLLTRNGLMPEQIAERVRAER